MKNSKYQDLQHIVNMLMCPDCNGTGITIEKVMNPHTFNIVGHNVNCRECMGNGISIYYRYLYQIEDLLDISNEV